MSKFPKNRANRARIVGFAFVVAVVCLPRLMSAANAQITSPTPVGTPEAIVAYAFLLANYPQQFSRSLDLARPGDMFSDLARFYRSVESVGGDVNTILSFNKHAFIVESDHPGQPLGFEPASLNLGNGGVLFVTTPLKKLNESVLMIVASSAPASTRILVVDKTLAAHLLFSSLNGPRVKNLVGSPVGTICDVRVERPEVFLLTEQLRPTIEGGPPLSTAIPRVFKLDVAAGIDPEYPLQEVESGSTQYPK